jgi:tetratricopeptide (TPR) repeat protein
VQDNTFDSEEHTNMIQHATSSLAEFHQSIDNSHINTAILLYEDALRSQSPENPKRFLTLFNLSDALVMRFHLAGKIDDLHKGISHLKDAIHLPSIPVPERFRCRVYLATNLGLRFHQTNDLQDMLDAVSISDGAPREDKEASASFSCATDLLDIFKQSGGIGELEQAVELLYTSLRLQPAPHPLRSTSLNNLALALWTRFEQKGEISDLEESIALHREALVLRPAPHPLRSRSLSNLANALSSRFQQKGELTDLGESIAFHREALVLFPAPHPDRSASLNNLGTAISLQFQQKGELSDLEESIALYHEALDLRPVPHPLRSTSLNNLASALRGRFEQKGELGDLGESIALHREALVLRPAPHPLRSASLNNLANALSTQFEQKGELSDLRESISLYREALVLRPAPHPLRSRSLNNLANALSIQFQQKGELGDLEESIALYCESLELRPAPHPLRSGSLNNLASRLSTRFKQKGELDDLEESIALHREALFLRPAPHPDQSASLDNLANVLLTRFQQKGELRDLEESLALHRKALILRPAPHHLRSGSLNNLAIALRRQFEWKGELGDLEESIALYREALILRPAPHPDRSTLLNNLAIALHAQFKQTGKLNGLEEAIALHHEALVLRPAPHPDRSASLTNLAIALRARFAQKGELGDLDKSIALHHEALDLIPAPHPDHSASLNNLAIAFLMRFQQKGELSDLEDSMKHFADASQYQTASVLQRFGISRNWAHCAASTHHPSALQAYQHTINLLPHLASLDLNLQKRHEALSHARGLASEACNYATQVGDFDKAVEFLSAGRAVFWAQALQLRTPFDELHPAAPQLADKLRAISRALELASSSYDDFQPLNSDSQHIRDLEKEATRCRVLNEKWNHTLDEVRRLEGFEDFLKPKSISKLREASSNGPVIMLNATSSRCDALIVTQDQVKHIVLSSITAETARCLGSDIQKALYHSGIRTTHDTLQAFLEPSYSSKHRKPRLADHTAEDTFKEVLEKLWFTVARPVIQALDLKEVKFRISMIILVLIFFLFQKPDKRSHIWWCPTGPFSFLPIHAAGIYQGNGAECVADHAISSYTPTLDALLSTPPPNDHKPNILAVIQSTMPRNRSLDLPFASEELEMIKRHVPSEWLTSLATNVDTTVENVLSCLPSISFAHFACHGSQNITNPLNSALILGDRDLKVSEIMQSHIPNASLAFLSACETAKGDENIPDEAMHLASAMLFAGYRGVVGTMWSVSSIFLPKKLSFDSFVILGVCTIRMVPKWQTPSMGTSLTTSVKPTRTPLRPL